MLSTCHQILVIADSFLEQIIHTNTFWYFWGDDFASLPGDSSSILILILIFLPADLLVNLPGKKLYKAFTCHMSLQAPPNLIDRTASGEVFYLRKDLIQNSQECTILMPVSANAVVKGAMCKNNWNFVEILLKKHHYQSNIECQVQTT